MMQCERRAGLIALSEGARVHERKGFLYVIRVIIIIVLNNSHTHVIYLTNLCSASINTKCFGGVFACLLL